MKKVFLFLLLAISIFINSNCAQKKFAVAGYSINDTEQKALNTLYTTKLYWGTVQDNAKELYKSKTISDTNFAKFVEIDKNVKDNQNQLNDYFKLYLTNRDTYKSKIDEFQGKLKEWLDKANKFFKEL